MLKNSYQKLIPPEKLEKVHPLVKKLFPLMSGKRSNSRKVKNVCKNETNNGKRSMNFRHCKEFQNTNVIKTFSKFSPYKKIEYDKQTRLKELLSMEAIAVMHRERASCRV